MGGLCSDQEVFSLEALSIVTLNEQMETALCETRSGPVFLLWIEMVLQNPPFTVQKCRMASAGGFRNCPGKGNLPTR